MFFVAFMCTQEVQQRPNGLPIVGIGNPESMDHPKDHLGGGFKYFLFSTLPGEMIQFDYIIFFRLVETTN